MHDLTPERFLNDVKEHKMTIIKDDGLYRHIRFKQPETNNMYFDLVTWPGYLCFCGDMGEYVFTRIRDMFEFFRGQPKGGKEIYINTGYWSEKCVAMDKNGKIEEFSPDKFIETIKYILKNEEDVSGELREAVESEVLAYASDGEERAYDRAMSFEWQGRCYFQDFYEHNCRDYTYSFVWCCYALAWGIKQYDQTTCV